MLERPTFSPGRPLSLYLDRLETTSPVPDLERNTLLQTLKRDAHPGGLRVLAHVRQRLLGNPEERRLYRNRYAFVAQRLLVANLATLVAQPLDLQADAVGQPKVVERRRPEIGDD